MRLFIGIPIPDEYVRAIHEIQSAWKGRLASKLSWVRPGLAHLTLKFLGETEEASVGAIVDAMRAAAGGNFVMQGGAGGFFPSWGAPRVVWLGFSRGVAECAAYFAALDAGLAGAGFAAKTRPHSSGTGPRSPWKTWCSGRACCSHRVRNTEGCGKYP
jgi:2'-5' RNA ligase